MSALRLRTILPWAISVDPTWEQIPSGIYGVVEVNLGIVCACAVSLRPLFRHLRPLWRRNKPLERPVETSPWKSPRHIPPPQLTLSNLSSTHIESENHDIDVSQASREPSGPGFSVTESISRRETGRIEEAAKDAGSKVASISQDGNRRTVDLN